MTLELDGRPLALHEEPIPALAHIAVIRDERPMVSGHVIVTPDFPPPYVLGLAIGDKITELGAVDGAPADDGKIEFSVTGQPPWPPVVPRRVTPQLGLIAADGRWALLPVAAGQAPLALDYLEERSFTRHVQGPSVRPQDKESLIFHARKFFAANAHRPRVRAAALTVLGHRILDLSWTEEGAAARCLADAEPVFDALAEMELELDFRWFLSLSLVCQYLYLTLGDSTGGLPRLRQVYARRDLLPTSPAQATNMLKATFHLGTTLWKQGRREEAEEILLSAKGTFHSAAAVWRFGNFYSSNELILSASLARACLVWLETAHHAATGQWRDPSYRVAKQDGSLFACLGFPSTQFLKQGLI